MPSVTFFKFSFTPSWKMLILAALFFALFLRLGFWQIQRADEKSGMLAAQNAQEQLHPILWEADQQVPAQYARIKVKGTYSKHAFLLDNQHYEHQFGYDIISPLILEDGSIILIDRGWVPADITRRILPEIITPDNLMQVQGSVYYPSKNQWVLGPESEKKTPLVTVIERLDTKIASQLLQKVVYPFIIRLDKQDSHGFVREWKTVSMPPQRHLAYALQWFAMAFVILIIFVALNLKKEK